MTQEEFNVVFELQMRKCADILAHKKKELPFHPGYHPEVPERQGGQSSYRCNHHQHSTGNSRNRCVWHTP